MLFASNLNASCFVVFTATDDVRLLVFGRQRPALPAARNFLPLPPATPREESMLVHDGISSEYVVSCIVEVFARRHRNVASRRNFLILSGDDYRVEIRPQVAIERVGSSG